MFSDIQKFDIESNLPLPEVLVSLGFFMVSALEEIIHYFIHPKKIVKKEAMDHNQFELQNRSDETVLEVQYC